MEGFFSKFLDFRKIPTEIFVLVSFLTGCFLFLPNDILSELNIKSFESEYGKYFGILFLVSTGILLIKVGKGIYKKVSLIFLRKKNKRRMLKYIENLDHSEQAVLREFYIKKQKSLDLPYDDPVVRNLINNGIIIKISEIGAYKIGGMLFPMRINKKLEEKITEENLGTSHLNNEEEKGEFVLNNRPKWAYDIDRFN